MKILSMLNPATAIGQALLLIYDVLKWVFNNAAKIFRLVETVVNGAADLLAGNIGGMAGGAIEKALASLIAPVIDFFAELVGLGDLPIAIAGAIKGLQARVEEILDEVIGFLVEKAKALIERMTGGKKKEGDAGGRGKSDGQVGDVETWTAAGESHKLWIAASGPDATVMMASFAGSTCGSCGLQDRSRQAHKPRNCYEGERTNRNSSRRTRRTHRRGYSPAPIAGKRHPCRS